VAKLILSPTSPTPIAHELTEELVTIGRGPDNLIQIDDPSVSGRHAQINCVGDIFHLQDLSSTNGTRVNDRTLTSVAVLHAGDRVRFGKVEARFECENPSHAQPLPVLTEVEAKPAEVSARPVDFSNASPFSRRKLRRDPVQTAIFVAAGLAVLAFLGSMIALMQMQPPAP
jgi:pSer/pThr/pTyr-binding forkhead associated (FHA) protein